MVNVAFHCGSPKLCKSQSAACMLLYLLPITTYPYHMPSRINLVAAVMSSFLATQNSWVFLIKHLQFTYIILQLHTYLPMYIVYPCYLPSRSTLIPFRIIDFCARRTLNWDAMLLLRWCCCWGDPTSAKMECRASSLNMSISGPTKTHLWCFTAMSQQTGGARPLYTYTVL